MQAGVNNISGALGFEVENESDGESYFYAGIQNRDGIVSGDNGRNQQQSKC